MGRNQQNTAILVSLLMLLVGGVLGNGGPFVIQYPDGDPAAKGVLARLDPDLKPTTETRLKVLKEDLNVVFQKERMFNPDNSQPPLAHVSAKYTIENPTDEAVTVDFGFPILRGVYTNPFGMSIQPDATVLLGTERINCTIISNSAIYGIIRQRAQETIVKALEEDVSLKKLVESVKNAKDENTREIAQQALSNYLIEAKNWEKRDSVLMAQYAGLDFNSENPVYPPDRAIIGLNTANMHRFMQTNLGPLGAIGEQKATQFFAQLASCFDADAAAGYEAIFAAWGGDVQERSLDLTTGKVRPREITVDKKTLDEKRYQIGDPAVYARVDYLDENANISEAEKAACRTILKNLPVVFTFAPMNILHYQVTFQPNTTQDLTVSYQQFAYKDTRDPESYQLAYVVHPASFWKEFGPINLTVKMPHGVMVRGSVPLLSSSTLEQGSNNSFIGTSTATIKDKTGEIYLAIDADSWNESIAEETQQPATRVSKGQ